MRDGRQHRFQAARPVLVNNHHGAAAVFDVSVHAVATKGAPACARVLIVTAGARACALPVHHVLETMRPLPIEPVTGTPEYVRGLSVIRGMPVPVVDLMALLDTREHRTTYGRFVTVKAEERRFALAVDSVVGVRDLELTQLEELPPLLRHADVDLIEAIGVVDEQLLVVLRGARIVPEEIWKAIETGMVTR